MKYDFVNIRNLSWAFIIYFYLYLTRIWRTLADYHKIEQFFLRNNLAAFRFFENLSVRPKIYFYYRESYTEQMYRKMFVYKELLHNNKMEVGSEIIHIHESLL